MWWYKYDIKFDANILDCWGIFHYNNGVCVAGKALLKGAALSATAAMASMVALNVLSLIGFSMTLALPVSLLYCLITGRENPADLFKGFAVCVFPIALILVSICAIALGAGVSASAIFLTF